MFQFTKEQMLQIAKKFKENPSNSVIYRNLGMDEFSYNENDKGDINSISYTSIYNDKKITESFHHLNKLKVSPISENEYHQLILDVMENNIKENITPNTGYPITLNTILIDSLTSEDENSQKTFKKALKIGRDNPSMSLGFNEERVSKIMENMLESVKDTSQALLGVKGYSFEKKGGVIDSVSFKKINETGHHFNLSNLKIKDFTTANTLYNNILKKQKDNNIENKQSIL